MEQRAELPLAVVRALQRFALSGDPLLRSLLNRGGFDRRQQPAKGLLRLDASREFQGRLQPPFVRLRPFHDPLEAAGSGDDDAAAHKDQLAEQVQAVDGAARRFEISESADT
ncbi:MAG TPA: hypothetical protein VL132_13965 [Planctomycetaceae bacterium]|nr:hypothetical protein [Planctomycetaceae bacterium]